MKKTCGLTLLAPLLLLAACSTGSPQRTGFVPSGYCESGHAPYRATLIKRILSLPPYLVHKETPSEFEKNLRQGDFYLSDQGTTPTLQIAGDSSCDKRVFYTDAAGRLFIIFVFSYGETACYATHFRYDASTRKLEQIPLSADEEGI